MNAMNESVVPDLRRTLVTNRHPAIVMTIKGDNDIRREARATTRTNKDPTP